MAGSNMNTTIVMQEANTRGLYTTWIAEILLASI